MHMIDDLIQTAKVDKSRPNWRTTLSKPKQGEARLRAASPLATLAIGFLRPIELAAHAIEFGLLVVGCGRRDIRRVDVRLHRAKLVERERFVPACLLLPGQGERLAGVLPGLLAASRQTTDLTEPCDPLGNVPRARVDTFTDPLLQQHAPLREAPLERRGKSQARRDRSQHGPVAGGTTEGQGLLQQPDGVLHVPLGEVQAAEESVGDGR